MTSSRGQIIAALFAGAVALWISPSLPASTTTHGSTHVTTPHHRPISHSVYYWQKKPFNPTDANAWRPLTTGGGGGTDNGDDDGDDDPLDTDNQGGGHHSKNHDQPH